MVSKRKEGKLNYMVDFLVSLNNFIWGAPFILFVMLIGLYFTARSGLFTFAHFGHVMKNTLGSLTSKEARKKDDKSVSPFEAVCVAIGGCVGTANIAGVATAMATGGYGAVFWLWLWAFFGMMVKIVEVTLGCYYRGKDENENYYGGPMYYMEKGILREMGLKVGGPLAVLFSFFFVFQSVQGSQGFTIAEIFNATFGWNMVVVVAVYSAVVLYLIWSGRQGAVNFATKCVPFMCVVYLVAGIVLIVLNIQNLPSAIVNIFHDAFTGTAAFGGFLGASVIQAMNSGVSRSMNSNEAGMGSSPLVHGSADCEHPMRQGLWGSFEVFVDTLIICSITALSVACSGVLDTGLTGATLTIAAYETMFGHFAAYYIAIMAIMFGLTTTTGYYIYYVTIIKYIFRHKPILRDKLIAVFKIYFPLMNVVVTSFIVFTGQDATLFWTIVSIVTAGPTFFNLIALFILRNKFFQIFKDYKARYLGKGNVDPNFHVFYEDDPEIAAKEEAIRAELRKEVADAYAHKG